MAKNKITSGLENTVAPASKAEDPVDNYETQGHLRTLQDAHGIINDAAKMQKVHKLAGRHAKALAGIKQIPMDAPPKMKSTDDLKNYRNQKFGGSGGKSAPKSLDSLKDTDQDGE